MNNHRYALSLYVDLRLGILNNGEVLSPARAYRVVAAQYGEKAAIFALRSCGESYPKD